MSLRVEAGFERLKDALADVIAREVEFPKGVFVTVLSAKVTANTQHAKIVLSVFPETEEAAVIKALRAQEKYIKEGLSEHLRLRRIPRLHYYFNENEAEAAKIDQLINEIEKQNPPSR